MRYLISYSIVLVIPLLLFGIVIFYDFLKVFKTEVIENNLEVLEQISQNVDVRFDEMNKIAASVQLSWELNPYSIKDNIVNQIAGVKELGKYRSSNGMIHEMLLVFDGYPTVSGASSTYSMDMYETRLFTFFRVSKAQFLNDLSSIKVPTVMPYGQSSDPSSFITYFTPIPVHQSNRYGTVIFIIEKQTVKSLLDIGHNIQNSNSVILDVAGEIVAASNERFIFDQSFRELVNGIEKSGWKSVRMDGGKYFASYVKSEKSEWTYIKFIPQKLLMKTVIDAQNKALYTFLMILVLGSGAIYLSMHMNYKPLVKLKRNLEEKLDYDIDIKGGMEELDTVIDRIVVNNNELLAKMEDYKGSLRRQLFINAMNGRIKSKDEFDKLSKELGIIFHTSLYRVFTVKINEENRLGSGRSSIKTEIVDMVENYYTSEDSVSIYGLNDLQKDMLTFVISFDGVELYESTHTILLGIEQYIRKMWDFPTVISVSHYADTIFQIPQLYLDACTALEHRLFNHNERVIFFKDIERIVSEATWYSHDIMRKLDLQIKQGDADVVRQTIEDLIFSLTETSQFVTKCLYFEIIHTISCEPRCRVYGHLLLRAV